MIQLPNGYLGEAHKMHFKGWVLNVLNRDKSFVKSFGPYHSLKKALIVASEFLTT